MKIGVVAEPFLFQSMIYTRVYGAGYIVPSFCVKTVLFTFICDYLAISNWQKSKKDYRKRETVTQNSHPPKHYVADTLTGNLSYSYTSYWWLHSNLFLFAVISMCFHITICKQSQN